jgi:KaiC/GvpD/RAD55 family RecA-like ATPase
MSLLNHSVQFYNDDMFLTQSVAHFITEGLRGNETVIIVATAQHREALQQVLTPEQMAHDKLRVFEAEEQLSKFMVAEWPSELRFRQMVDGVLGQARQSGPVRIFGEMVAVLWARRNTWAALRLEALWNKLLEEHSFALLCAYPMSNLSTDHKSVQAISRFHTHVHTQ